MRPPFLRQGFTMNSVPKRFLFLRSLNQVFMISMMTALSVAAACQQPRSSTSQPLHREGELDRPDASTFTDCKAVAPAPETLNGMQNTVNAYIRDLATAIMTRTNESLARDGRAPLFVGELAPETFCFVTPPQVFPEINASATTSRRELSFKPYTFLALPDEPALAGIMCHELAHVTMRHGTSKDVRTDIEQTFMSAPDFDERFRKSLDICNSLPATTNLTADMLEKLYGRSSATYQIVTGAINEVVDYINTHFFEMIYSFGSANRNDDIMVCRDRAEIVEALLQVEVSPDALATLTPQELTLWNSWLAERKTIEETVAVKEGDVTPRAALHFFHELANQLDTAYATGRNSLISWKEQEADEVGYEICLRAGVDVRPFAALHHLTVKEEEKAGPAQCLPDIEAGHVPNRKLGTHPTACWRIFDIEKREQSEHAAYYQDLLERIPRQELLGSARLEQVLNAVRPLGPQEKTEFKLSPEESPGSPN